MKHICLVFFILLLVVAGCGDNGSSATSQQPGAAALPPGGGFRSVEPMAARQLLEKRQGIFLLDVRSQQELREGAIAGSVLVPFWAVVQGQLDLPPDTPIILICAVGGRSYAAGQALYRRGYKEIYNLSGGISAWKRAGLPVVYGN